MKGRAQGPGLAWGAFTSTVPVAVTKARDWLAKSSLRLLPLAVLSHGKCKGSLETMGACSL